MANALVFGLPLLPLALSVDRITNGLTRPFFGWLSDQIGREHTMVIAFTLEGTAMIAWLFTGSNTAIFVVMSGVVLFGCGEIFSLFPSTLTDTYGTGHATTNMAFDTSRKASVRCWGAQSRRSCTTPSDHGCRSSRSSSR
jgi:MFS family permease